MTIKHFNFTGGAAPQAPSYGMKVHKAYGKNV